MRPGSTRGFVHPRRPRPLVHNSLSGERVVSLFSLRVECGSDGRSSGVRPLRRRSAVPFPCRLPLAPTTLPGRFGRVQSRSHSFSRPGFVPGRRSRIGPGVVGFRGCVSPGDRALSGSRCGYSRLSDCMTGRLSLWSGRTFGLGRWSPSGPPVDPGTSFPGAVKSRRRGEILSLGMDVGSTAVPVSTDTCLYSTHTFGGLQSLSVSTTDGDTMK